jgi:hypothetical protein
LDFSIILALLAETHLFAGRGTVVFPHVAGSLRRHLRFFLSISNNNSESVFLSFQPAIAHCHVEMV